MFVNHHFEWKTSFETITSACFSYKKPCSCFSPDIKHKVQIRSQISLSGITTKVKMSIGFHIVDKEFLEKLEDYIKIHADEEKEKFPDVSKRILNANIAYQYLCEITGKDLAFEDIYKKHVNLGLIGPGNGFLTGILEKLFGSSETFKKHAVLHDVFGNFYLDFEEGPGYAYASPLWLPSFLRDEPLIGQISGLLLCSKTDFSYE